MKPLVLVYRLSFATVYWIARWLSFLPIPGRRAPRPVGPAEVWIHAVSGGEVLLARTLIDLLRPASVHLTTRSASGRSEAAKLEKADARVRWATPPLDAGPAVRARIRAVRPRLFLVLEHDLWPVLLDEFGRAGIPRVMVNAALKPRDAAALQRFPLLRPLLWNLDLAFVQNAVEAESLRAHRMDRRFPVIEAGNLKYRALRFEATPAFEAEGRSVVVFGSSHPNEEALLFSQWDFSKKDRLLVIAPRHVERASAIRDLFAKGARAVLFSALPSSSSPPRIPDDVGVLIADVMGRLPDFYAAARVALVGDTFQPTQGGHNVLEPAALGVPVVYGSFLRMYADATPLLEAEGAGRRTAPENLMREIDALLADDTERRRRGEAARRAALALRFDETIFLEEIRRLKS